MICLKDVEPNKQPGIIIRNWLCCKHKTTNQSKTEMLVRYQACKGPCNRFLSGSVGWHHFVELCFHETEREREAVTKCGTMATAQQCSHTNHFQIQHEWALILEVKVCALFYNQNNQIEPTINKFKQRIWRLKHSVDSLSLYLDSICWGVS